MKLSKAFLFLLFLLFFTPTIAQKFDSPVEYLDFVSETQEVITKNMWNYTKAIAHSKSDKNVTNKRNTLIKSIQRARLKIERADGYDGDDYKNQVLKNLSLNESLLKQDYEKIIDMKEVAERSYDLMEAYILARELADIKMTEAQNQYEDNFYAFAKKHEIEILESESDLGEKMEISSAVFKHYNEMYLHFFKVNINEVYLWDAMEKQDIGAIRQNINALADAAAEGLEKLNTIEVYKNDKSLVESTRKAFEFFTHEAEVQVPKLLDFLILNEDFENIKSALESTKEMDRTKEQVDEYNDKVKQLNKGIKDYNKLNATLNKSRQSMINSLNSVNNKFLARHIPND